MKAIIVETTFKPIRKFKFNQINQSKIGHIELFFLPISTEKFNVNEGTVSNFTSGASLSGRFNFVDFSSVLQRSRSVQRTSSALALARKITMANNRRKKAEAVAQEAGLQSPSSFIPRSPVQQYPYFSWRQKGDCLSSTKVKEVILFIKTVTCKRRSKHGPITRGLTFFLCSLCLVSFA